jgi:protoporphyrinogen oxidase
MKPQTAIVVGAGLSGLAVAFYLQESGFAVRVLERSDSVGGRVRTARKQGYVIDSGPDAATAGYREFLALLRAVGMQATIVPSNGVIGLLRNGVVHDVDPQRLLAALSTPALSWRAKWQLLVGALRVRPRLRGIDAFELFESADQDDPSTNAWDFSERLFGAEVTDYLIDPALRLTTGSGARQASQLGVLGALSAWTQPLVTITGGLDALPGALAQRVPVSCGAEVTQVSDSADGVSVEYHDAGGESHVGKADYCVITAMYDAACSIWQPLATLVPQFGRELRNVKLISISLGYKVQGRSKAYVIQVPSKEYPDVLLMFLQHNKAPDRAPPGHSLITLYTDTLATDKYLSWSDADIEAWASGIVESVFPELGGQRELCEVTRWPKAGYHAAPGFWRRSRDLQQALPATARVQIAGDLFGAGSMESAVRCGKRIADRIISTQRVQA